MQFAERGQVGLVVDHERGHPVDPLGQWRVPGEQGRHGDVPPAQVRRQPDGAGVVDQSGYGECRPGQGEALRGRVGPGPYGQRDEPGERVGGGERAQVGAVHRVVAYPAGQVDHAGGQVVDVDLQAEPGRPVAGQHESPGRAARSGAWRRLGLGDQPAGDEVLDDRGDGGPGEAGLRGEVGPGGRAFGGGYPAEHHGEVEFPQAALADRPHGSGGSRHPLTVPQVTQIIQSLNK